MCNTTHSTFVSEAPSCVLSFNDTINYWCFPEWEKEDSELNCFNHIRGKTKIQARWSESWVTSVLLNYYYLYNLAPDIYYMLAVIK